MSESNFFFHSVATAASFLEVLAAEYGRRKEGGTKEERKEAESREKRGKTRPDGRKEKRVGGGGGGRGRKEGTIGMKT